MVQKVYNLFKHPKLYLEIKVCVLSNHIIIVISCKEGIKASSPHLKSTLQIMPFFRLHDYDSVMTEPLLYSF